MDKSIRATIKHSNKNLYFFINNKFESRATFIKKLLASGVSMEQISDMAKESKSGDVYKTFIAKRGTKK